MAVLRVANDQTDYESPLLLMVCIFVCSTATAILVAILLGRSYLVSGKPGLLWLGCGVVLWGAAGSLAATVLMPHGTNAFISGHNTLVTLAAGCHLAGVLLAQKPRSRARAPALMLVLACAGTAVAVWVTVWLAIEGQLGLFFVQGTGGTPLRSLVLAAAIVMFAITAAVLGRVKTDVHSAFMRWYGLALLLVATGLLGVLLQSAHGTLLGWTGRTAQFLGGLYMLVAAVAAVKETRAWRISLETALSDQSQRYDLIMAGSHAAIWDWDVVNHQVTSSPQWKKLRGLEPEDVGDGEEEWRRGIHPDDAPRVMAAAQAHFDGQTPVFMEEYRVRCKDGTWKWILDRGVALRDGRGRVVRMAGSEEDISTRKIVEEALRESEERMQQALRISRSFTFEWQPSTDRVLRSASCEPILGLTGNEALNDTGQAYFQRVHPDDRERFVQMLRGLTPDADTYITEYRIVRGDGRMAILEETGRAFFNANGILQRLVGVTTDITVRQKAEEALRESEAKYRMLFQNMTEGFALYELIYDAQGRAVDWRVLEVNDAYVRHTGLRRDRVVGRRASEIFPAAIEQYLPRFAAVVATGIPSDVETFAQAVGRYQHVSTFPACGHRFANIIEDITTRKEAENATRESREDLNSAQAVAHVGSWRLDVRKNELRWSDENWRIFGVARDTPLTYETFLSSVHPDDRAFVDAKWQAALRGEPYDIEHRIVSGDTIKWVRERAYLEFDEQGALCGGFGTTQDITDLRMAQQELRESEARYRTLFDTMTEGFALHELICDARGQPCDYRFIDINPAFETLTGLKREAVLGRTVREVLPGIEPAWITRYGRVVQTGVSERFDAFSTDLGRHYEVVAFRTSPGHFAAIFDDITALRTLQRREKEDAVRLAWGQSAINTIRVMHEGVVLMDMDGTIISVNPAVEHLTGRTGATLVGGNIKSLLSGILSGGELTTARRAFKVLRHGGTPPPMRTLKLWRADGTGFQVLPSMALTEAPEGGREMVVLTLRDVTELYEATERLERSERKYRELVENANSIIMRITPDHTITFFNEYAQTFFGYEAGEVVGRNVVGTIVPEVDSEGRDMRAVMQEISATPELHVHRENENKLKDGRRVWVHWSNRALRDNQGRIVEILCVGTDITRRKEMEAEARRYQQRLRELAERLTVAEEQDRWRISRYIHDTVIQNLSLSSIHLGALARPQAGPQVNDENQRLQQARTLIEQAIEECRMVMSDLTPALLYELGLIPALNDFARHAGAQYGARVIVDDDGQELPLSHPLRGLLFECVRELVMNALKHAGPCEIRVRASFRAPEVVLCVADNGRGFDVRQAENPPSRHGGFGLFSIRQRVEGLGGRLDLESMPGRGTTARITMPLTSAEAAG